MAYYSPHTEDPYYDPRRNTEEFMDPMGAIVSTVKTMVGYGILSSAAFGVAGLLGKGIGKGVQKYAMKAKGHTQFARRLSRDLNKPPGISDIVKSITPMRDVYATTLKAQRPYRHALAKRTRHLKQLKETDWLRANKETFTSVFKDRKTFAGTMGSMFVKHGLQGSLMFYGIDTALGHTDYMGIERKSIWDVPGHVMNYAKYMKHEAPIFMAWGAMGGVAKGIQGGIGMGARGFFDKNQKFKEKMIGGLSSLTRPFYTNRKDIFSKETIAFQSAIEKKFITRTIANVKATWGTGVEQMINNARVFFTKSNEHARQAVKHSDGAGGVTTRVKEKVETLIQNTKDIWKQKKAAALLSKSRGLSEIPGMSVINAFEDLGALEFHANKPLNNTANSGTGQLLVEGLTRHNDQIKPKSFIASVLGLKATKAGDVVNTKHVREISSRMGAYFPDGSTEPLEQALSSAYMGKHFYRKGKFHVDLSYFSPIHQLKRLANKLGGMNFNLLIGVPPVGRNISLGGILTTDTLLSDPISATVFRKSTTGTGLIVDSNKIAQKGTGVKPHEAPLKNLKQLVNEAYGKKPVGDDMAVAYIGRQFYALDGTNISPLGTKETVLKYSHPSVFGMAGEGKTSNLRRWLYHNNREIESAEGINLLKQHYERMEPQNPFQWFQKTFDWSAPRYASHISNKIRNLLKPGRVHTNGKMLDHKSELIATAAEGIFGKDLRMDGLHEHVQAMFHLYGHTTQDVAPLLKKPHVFNELSNRSLAKLKGDASIMHSDTTFLDLLSQNKRLLGDKFEPENLYSELFNNPELSTIYNTGINYPNKIRENTVFHRHGRLSRLSEMDLLRTRYVSSAVDIGGGPEAFVEAADYLLGKNLIVKSEAKALKTHGYLTTLFRDGKLVNQFPQAWDQKSVDLTKQVVNKYKSQHQAWLNDTIDYISDTDLREPSFKFSNFRLLTGETYNALKLPSEFQSLHDSSPFTSFSMDPHGQLRHKPFVGRVADIAFERLTNLVNDLTGLKKNPFKYGDGAIGSTKYLTTRMAQVAGAMFAYKTLDAIVASNPAFDQTSLDAGITGFAADEIAKTHLLSSRVGGFLGITKTAQYLEGLMPGFTSSAPGALIGGALNWKGGALSTVGGVVKGAIVNRVMSPMMPDATKTYEQLASEYSGESQVPIIDNKMWFLGTTPWQGRGVSGWQPNWYVRAKSRWKSSDTLYGSELRKVLHEPIFPLGISIGDFTDPYYMERKHFFSRPYPETGDWGQEIPLGIGPLIGGTIGRLLKPKKLMHREFMDGSDIVGEDQISAIRPPSYKESRGMMMTSVFNPRKFSAQSSYQGSLVYSGTKAYGQNMADKSLDSLENAAGLIGFGIHSMRQGLAPRPMVVPTIETAGRIASQARGYYDMNLGGLGIFTEGVRRFVEKPDWRRYGVNPIPNLMPQWLGERFTTGDPMSKIIRGELRMPGEAYARTHPDLEHTLPGRASLMGATQEHITQYFTGLLPPVLKEQYDIMSTGTKYHKNVQNWLAAEGMLIKAESLVYDIKNDISGHVDAIIRDGTGGRGRRALEIKTISDEGILKLKGPKYEHVSQLNFYLNQLNLKKGSIMYINRDNPSDFRLYEVSYNHDRYSKDLEKLQKARLVASKMLAKGIEGDGYGYAYSWLDRMAILADVSPNSPEYREAKFIVQKQLKGGMLNQKQIEKYHRIQQQRKATIRKYETYPLRFKGKIMSPDSEVNIQSLNENIKAGVEYSLPERAIGAAWEEFTNTNFQLINKFFAFKDPVEHYKQYQVYGKEYTPWTDPYGSFIAPGGRVAMSQSDPLRGALSWGLGPAYFVGGRAAAVYGGIAGGLYGAAHGMVRKVTGKVGIPEEIEREREINDYFDQLKYYKNERLSQLAGGLESKNYYTKSQATLTGITQDGGTYTDFFKAAGQREKPYIEAWLNEKNERSREEILRMVPEKLGQGLKTFWDKNDSKESTSEFVRNTSDSMAGPRRMYRYTDQELDPNIFLEDVKLKTINKAGLNAHNFGLGWQDQMIRVQNDLDSIEGSDIKQETMYPETTDSSAVKSSLYNLFNKLGMRNTVRVYVNNHADDENTANVTIKRSRVLDIQNALNNRQRFM
jgi:hypothetical protein